MRIIGGSHSGRRFSAPKGFDTRPTSDRVREALFSALESRHAIADKRVLDLFAGTGALAFESLSRGASSALLFEQDATALKLIKATATAFELSDRCRFNNGDAFKRAARLGTEFDLVFLDPPYKLSEKVPQLVLDLMTAEILSDGAIVCVEYPTKQPILLGDLSSGSFVLDQEARYKYGDTSIALMRSNKREQT